MVKTFELNDKEYEMACQFEKDHEHKDVNLGAIGGNISVTFTITSIGELKTVKCGVCDCVQNITDYDIL